MKKFIMLFTLIASLMMAVGCSSMKVVTIDQLPDPTNGKSNVVMYSIKVVPHSGIMVDGIDKGSVLPWEPLYFQVDTGVHTLYARFPFPAVINRELAFDFYPNETYYFRLEHESGLWTASNWIRPAMKIESYSANCPNE